MRLPLWLRFLMPLMGISMILALTVGSFTLLWSLHQVLHPEISLRAISGGAIAVMIFPSFFGALAPALMLLNLCLHSIPPLRRIFEENSKGLAGASYDESMRDLRKLAIVIVPPSFVIALIGAIAPWAP